VTKILTDSDTFASSFQDEKVKIRTTYFCDPQIRKRPAKETIISFQVLWIKVDHLRGSLLRKLSNFFRKWRNVQFCYKINQQSSRYWCWN